MVRALIFDFNGVLADDDPIHEEAFQQVAREEGLAFTHQQYLDTYLPLNDWDCFRILFSAHSKELAPAKLDELIRRKGAYYFQAIANRCVLFKGAARAVRAAAKRYPLAIASGARIDEIQHVLAEEDLAACFTAIVAAEDVRRGKPHPEPFLKACEQLSQRHGPISPSDCIAVEDSIGGIESAHQAGMRCLGITHSYSRERLKESRPAWIIESIEEFGPWLEKTT